MKKGDVLATLSEEDLREKLAHAEEAYQKGLIALEQADTLTRLDLAFDYQEQDIPVQVTEGLRAQYDYWTEQWQRAASKGLEAIPPVGTRIAATPSTMNN